MPLPDDQELVTLRDAEPELEFARSMKAEGHCGQNGAFSEPRGESRH
jgi:hypothetical protein